MTRFTLARFPHSGIPGSMPACGSPRLFAACHALHRLSVPRHPLHALIRPKPLLFRRARSRHQNRLLPARRHFRTLPHTLITTPTSRSHLLLLLSNSRGPGRAYNRCVRPNPKRATVGAPSQTTAKRSSDLHRNDQRPEDQSLVVLTT